LGWYQFNYHQELRVKTLVRYLEAARDNLIGLSDDELNYFVKFWMVQNNRAWLEDLDGKVLIGQPWPGMSASDRGPEKVRKSYEYPETTVLVLKQKEPSVLALVNLERDGLKMRLCFNWSRGALIMYWSVLFQGLAGLLLLSFILSLWTANRISKPLTILRNKVVKIAQGDLSLKLDEKGEDEVADVSRAVNDLTSNLALHIDSLKQLMANMSHEMRSTVTNISLSMEITEESLNPYLGEIPEASKNRIARNLSQARTELDILENMVASGLLGGKLDLRHEGLDSGPLDFSSLCREVLDRHAHRAIHGGLELSGNLVEGIWLLGDEVLLERLLTNILDNAVKYTLPGGKIELNLNANQDSVILTCLNTHSPLSDEQLKNLCLAYYRVEQGQVQGSGLGLYLAHRITVLHGGQLNTENTSQGLLFTFTFPVPDENEREEAI
jgi:signal transduction histidine kinase